MYILKQQRRFGRYGRRRKRALLRRRQDIFRWFCAVSILHLSQISGLFGVALQGEVVPLTKKCWYSRETLKKCAPCASF